MTQRWKENFLGGYVIAYQRILKYLLSVRKVRKYRRTLKRKTTPKIETIHREKVFSKNYKEELNKTTKYLKEKPKIKSLAKLEINSSVLEERLEHKPKSDEISDGLQEKSNKK